MTTAADNSSSLEPVEMQAMQAASVGYTPPVQSAVTVVVQAIAVVLCVLSCLGIAYLMADHTLLTAIVTAVLANVGIIVNFWYGSSRSSQSKDGVIAAVLTGGKS